MISAVNNNNGQQSAVQHASLMLFFYIYVYWEEKYLEVSPLLPVFVVTSPLSVPIPGLKSHPYQCIQEKDDNDDI